jgi:hypothetical protein
LLERSIATDNRSDGLEEIGKRVGLEGREGVLVVPRGEDDERDLDGGRNRPQYLEALEHGHFYVEKQKIRPELFDLLNRLEAILSLADHSDFGMSAEQPDQPRASIRLIVNDQAPHHAAAPLSRGNRIVTRVPPACRTSIVIRPWS